MPWDLLKHVKVCRWVYIQSPCKVSNLLAMAIISEKIFQDLQRMHIHLPFEVPLKSPSTHRKNKKFYLSTFKIMLITLAKNVFQILKKKVGNQKNLLSILWILVLSFLWKLGKSSKIRWKLPKETTFLHQARKNNGLFTYFNLFQVVLIQYFVLIRLLRSVSSWL